MKVLLLSMLIAVFCYSPFVLGFKNDALAELAKSQNMNELLQANRKANQEEWLRGACQRQIDEKQWPTMCWQWLEDGLKHKRLSDKKKNQWISYLNGLCHHIAGHSASLGHPNEINSKLWKGSRCAALAKKFGPSFEQTSGQ